MGLATVKEERERLCPCCEMVFVPYGECVWCQQAEMDMESRRMAQESFEDPVRRLQLVPREDVGVVKYEPMLVTFSRVTTFLGLVMVCALAWWELFCVVRLLWHVFR